MAKLKMTDSSLKSKDLKPGQYFDTVEQGLMLIVGKTKRSFYHWFSIKNKKDRRLLGAYGIVSLKDARQMVRDGKALIVKGINPKHHSAKVTDGTFYKVARLILDDMKTLAEDEIKKGQIPKPGLRTIADYDSYLNNHLKPIYDDPMDSMQHSLLSSLFKQIAVKSGRSTSNKVRAFCRLVFNIAIKEGSITRIDNPVLRTDPQKTTSPDQTGQGDLSENQIAELWVRSALEDPMQRFFLRMALLTGVRAGNICAIEWDEINGTTWEIPANKFKGRRQFIVPLSDQVKRLIKDHRKCMDKAYDPEKRDSDFLLPAKRSNGKRPHMGTTSLHKVFLRVQGLTESQVAKARKSGNPIDYFSSHALRKTVETQMSVLEIDQVVIDQCMGHQMQGLKRRYNKHDFLPQKGDAFQNYADHIERIVVKWKAANPKKMEKIFAEWKARNEKRGKYNRKNVDKMKSRFDKYR